MALIKILFQYDENNETEVTHCVSDEMGREILSMLEFRKMLQSRIRGVNVNDLTQTPRNKFTDGIGG